jgi:hypothetical protein
MAIVLYAAIEQKLWPIVAIGHAYAVIFEFIRQLVKKGRGSS